MIRGRGDSVSSTITAGSAPMLAGGRGWRVSDMASRTVEDSSQVSDLAEILDAQRQRARPGLLHRNHPRTPGCLAGATVCTHDGPSQKKLRGENYVWALP